MTAVRAVRDPISIPRATASAVPKASRMFTMANATCVITAARMTVTPADVARSARRIITTEPVMPASTGLSRQAKASAARQVTRILMTASATSAVRQACTTVIPAPAVRGILHSITMAPAIHAVKGITNTRQAKASAVPKVTRIITTASAMQSPRILVPV